MKLRLWHLIPARLLAMRRVLFGKPVMYGCQCALPDGGIIFHNGCSIYKCRFDWNAKPTDAAIKLEYTDNNEFIDVTITGGPQA